MQAHDHRAFLATLLLAAVAAAPGCTQPQGEGFTGGGEVLHPPSGTISVYQLAGRLGMDVARASRGSATLHDGVHTVVLFADPDGQVHVDGTPVGPTGDIVRVGGMLFVSESRVGPLRRALDQAPDPQPKPRPALPDPHAAPAPKGVIVLDAGHGGKDPGCTSVHGLSEKAVNLPVALAAARRLRADGYQVILTRDDDRFIELNDRATLANRRDADLFVSIHADWAPNPNARGFTVYIAETAGNRSPGAADALTRRLAQVCAHSRGVRRANFRVLVRTTVPSALVELGYMSNADEARKLADATYQRRLAEAIAAAADEFVRSAR